MAILGGLAVLRLISFATDVSIFALNLTTAMGLALAIDYTLLMISRFRDELADGASRDDALVRTMASAGRTVMFSATTVALSMAVLVLFPMHFLKSFAYAGVATVTFAAVAAIVVTPAALVLLGGHLDSLDVRRLARRMLGRSEPQTVPLERRFWYRSASCVMHKAIPLGLAGVALLLLLGAPFLSVRWGFPDDRVLPTTASAHQVGDQLRRDFVNNSDAAVTVVVPDTDGVSASDIDRYAANLATGLSWALERLTRHPSVLAKAQHAADAEDAAGDEYLDAVAKETLRIRPVVFDVGRVLKEPVELAGYQLPAGVMVVPGIGLVHSNSEVYPDADRFDPDRMVGATLSPTTWFPFGGGNRRCLGATFAMVEMRVVLREILRRVELATTTAAGERQRVKHVIMVPHSGGRIRVRAARQVPVSSSPSSAIRPAG
jgi:hypothetical protein